MGGVYVYFHHNILCHRSLRTHKIRPIASVKLLLLYLIRHAHGHHAFQGDCALFQGRKPEWNLQDPFGAVPKTVPTDFCSNWTLITNFKQGADASQDPDGVHI